ncbi:hypothetical protein HBB16_16780 [Pseudonocardia sp. MCCB 268]|nr:hypothetical protein [Pseudonocardia cytotoxica]
MIVSGGENVHPGPVEDPSLAGRRPRGLRARRDDADYGQRPPPGGPGAGRGPRRGHRPDRVRSDWRSSLSLGRALPHELPRNQTPGKVLRRTCLGEPDHDQGPGLNLGPSLPTPGPMTVSLLRGRPAATHDRAPAARR